MKIGPDLQTFWDSRAAMNFILGGTGSGLMFTSALALISGDPASLPLLAGAAMVALGLVCVWFEIGRPARFLNVFRNPYTSWMSREAWVAIVLLPCGIAAALSGWTLFAVVALFLSPTFVYCQAKILCASTGVPSWRRPGTLWLIVTTGLAEGVAIYLVFSVLNLAVGLIPAAYTLALALALAMVLIGVRALLWWRWRGALQSTGPAASFTAMRRIDPGFLVAGHLVPALAIAAAMAVPEIAMPLVLVGSVLTLAAGWVLKYVLITRAAHTQGFALEGIPSRGGDACVPGIRPGW